MERQPELMPFMDQTNKEAVCRVEILPLAEGRHAVICEELDDNPGQSVSLSWESVVAKVCQKFRLSPQAVVWIEHNQESVKTDSRILDRWQLVTFKTTRDGRPAGEPEWRNMTKDDWHELGLKPRE